MNATVGGTITAGDWIKITVQDQSGVIGSEPITYNIVSGDTTSTAAAGLAAAMNADQRAQMIGVVATSNGPVVSMNSAAYTPVGNDGFHTQFLPATSVGATETLSMLSQTNKSRGLHWVAPSWLAPTSNWNLQIMNSITMSSSDMFNNQPTP